MDNGSYSVGIGRVLKVLLAGGVALVAAAAAIVGTMTITGHGRFDASSGSAGVAAATVIYHDSLTDRLMMNMAASGAQYAVQADEAYNINTVGEGQFLKRSGDALIGDAGHTQNTDTGTTGTTFTVDSDAATGKISVTATAGAADKTMTVTNAALTDNRTITLPDATGTVALTSDIPAGHTQNTDTGTTGTTFTVDSDAATGKIAVTVAAGAADKTMTVTNAALTDNRTITLPDATGTVALTSNTLPRGYIDGLITSNAADAGHDITISVGEARDSTDAYDLSLAAAMTKQIDAEWAAGSAAGGLFSGSVGNATWYHVFLIRKDSDGSIDAGFDTSVSAANKPAGYTAYRRIGSVLTNGSANIISFTQFGDTFTWVAQILDVSGATGSDTPALVTISVPLGLCVVAKVRTIANSATVGQTYTAYNALNASTTVTECAARVFVASVNNPTTEARVPTNASSQVYNVATGSSVTCTLVTNGWIDPRGKDQ